MLHFSQKIFCRFLFCFLVILSIAAPGSAFAVDTLQGIKNGLHSSSWKDRLAAVEKLGKRRDKEALNILLDVAGTWTEKWPVKIRAIEYLGKARYAKSLELLLTIFHNPFRNWACPAIKSYTATALGNFKGNQEVVDTLISGTGDSELLVREASVRSLGKIGDPQAVPYLIKLLKDPNVSIRLSVVKALGEIGDPGAIPDIRHVLKNERDSVVINEALTALNNVREKIKAD